MPGQEHISSVPRVIFIAPLKSVTAADLGPLFFERKVIQYIESRPEVYEKSRQDIHKVYINLKYHLLFYDNDIHNTIITTSRQPEIPFPG